MSFRSDSGNSSASTVTFPNLRDPSELRSEFNGKVVHYLVADGESVGKDQPYVELEAMKMIMSLRADEAGTIQQALSPGAIVAPGQLLASLDLADPSSVQTVKTFSGAYPLQIAAGGESTIEQTLMTQLSGYAISPNMSSTDGASLVQTLFSMDADAAIDSTSRLLACFLRNEAHFAGLVGGEETQIIPRFAGEKTDLFTQIVAHHALPESLATVATLLRTLRSRIRERDGSIDIPEELVESLKQTAALPVEGGYGEVALLAQQLIDEVERPDGLSMSIGRRREEIKSILAETPKKDLKVLAENEHLHVHRPASGGDQEHPCGDPEEGLEGARRKRGAQAHYD